MRSAENLVFGPFRFELANERLWQGKRQIKLRTKPLAMLRYLLEHPGRLVTKDELQQQVWGGTIITNTVLKVCVREIRAALSDDAKKPQFIETEHGRGYRFIALLTTNQSGVNRPTSRTVPLSRSPRPTPLFAGRERELVYLHELLTRALAGERQVVFVTGEAGVGKTALVDTFLEHVAAEGQVWLGRGQCIQQYGAGEAYMPVLEALGRLCRGPGNERVINVLHHYAPTWAVQLPGLREEAEFEAPQRQGWEVAQERMLREMAEALEALTVEHGLVLRLEDLQWSDHSTLDLLSYLAQRQEQARLLVIGTYRPVDVVMSDHRLKGLKQELQARGQCEEIILEMLSPKEVTEYVERKFTASPLTYDLARFIHQRTDGNALFMVTLVNHLINQGLLVQTNGQWEFTQELGEVSVGIPDSLRHMIDKQVEELGEEEQRVVEVASVAGEQFAVAAVAAGVKQEVEEVEEICEKLARRGQFLQEQGLEEWPDGTVSGCYQFQHAFYRDVLYGRIANARRARLHSLIGERKEAGYKERAPEIAGELAVCFEQALDSQRAIQYHRQAGETALRRYAYWEAISHLTRGIELLQTLPDTPERDQQELLLQLALGVPFTAVKGFGAQERGKAYTRAQELCQQFGDVPQLFLAILGQWTSYLVQGDLQTAHQLAEKLMHLAQNDREPALLLRAHNVLGATCFFLGEFVSARAHFDQVISSSSDPHQSPPYLLADVQAAGVTSRSIASWTLWSLGYPDQALRISNEAITLAQATALPFSQAMATGFAAFLHSLCREERLTRERAEVGIALANEYGFTFFVTLGVLLRDWTLVEQQQEKKELAQLRQGVDAWRAVAELALPYFLTLLAEMYEKRGQSKEGLTVIVEALQITQKTGERWYEAELYRSKGDLLLQSGVPRHASRVKKGSPFRGQRAESRVADTRHPTPDALVEVEECFHQALEIARRQQAKSLELRAAMSLSRLWRQQGKKKEARQLLAEVYGWFTEGFDTPDLKEAKALLKELGGKSAQLQAKIHVAR